MAVKKPTSTAVVDWEAELAAQAKIAAAAQRATGGGKFFSMKAGQLSFDGVPLPGNQMAVIIIANTIENSYYDTPYDPDTPASPKCFAFATSEDELTPHEAVDNDPYFERQHDSCTGCPQNAWGSARTGKGKACSNVRGLAAELGRPPHGVFSNVVIEPDPKSQFRVVFEVLGNVPNELMATVMRRHSAEQDTIDFPYSPPMVKDEPAPAKPVNAKLRKR